MIRAVDNPMARLVAPLPGDDFVCGVDDIRRDLVAGGFVEDHGRPSSKFLVDGRAQSSAMR